MKKIPVQQSLGEFLRATRERLTPEQVGLPSYGRRRTPGLRREEVAHLANVGVSWYTSIEQGKDVHPSHQVLESLATALRLSDDERRYLFLLSKSDEMEESEIYKAISKGLERTVFALESHPAYIIGKYWDVLLWNRAAEFVFRFPPYSAGINPKPNLVHHFLIGPFRKEMDSDWEERAKIMIARFRADCARYPQDARLNKMIEKFMQESELFSSWWPRYEVKTVTDCHKLCNDPRIGELEFDHVNLQVSDCPDLKLMIYTASPSTAEKLKQKIYSYTTK
ncbi:MULTISPECIES: helix-turn-helix transcriptional regulator [Pelosinus]|jgi:transcriptional regulator with XRE-family HTH domain|uniref:Helix-turn-helix domain protein n=1 Tax=Pelosinus fermentans B4 TaxID=1149862 RepID=I9L886_9FIRM|nr:MULTISPECIES: helix-turn-helix transcriptional regulator [Pelosinus]EIW16476.1 helix-turn-helix domain protein [Pelosinus fermentans B4]EIW22543.1 helix-turn-helix domain protein [Pelosinus fermentans A11]OAM95783.1 helix-turn-helix domain protein [Pelosinus fermentans DSM 17108]SDR32764.1 Helix-turn-helix domain-containing protein [Pelosinus fermentans]